MKKLLWLGIVFSLLYLGHTHAAGTFSISAKDTTINATFSGVKGSPDTFRLVVLTAAFPAGNPATSYTNEAAIFNTADTDKQPDSTGTVTWSLSNYSAITPGKTYYARVIDITPKKAMSYATTTATVTITAETITLLPLKTAPATDGNTKDIIVSGQIDTSKIPNFNPAHFSAQLLYGPAISGTTLTNASGPFSAYKISTPNPDPNTDIGINGDGTYYWRLNGSILGPSTTYYLQQTVTDTTTGVKVTDPAAGQSPSHFNTSDAAIVIPGTTSETAYDQQHGYTLLSAFPNLSFLPDPQLCAEKRAAALNNPAVKAPAVCDLNDFINYMMKLLIGLSAVFLVGKIMYEGYQLMVTDVPFLRASAKSGLMTSLLGLVLALTSYLILNTINPKLVDESINVQQLAIGVPGSDGLGLQGTGTASGTSDINWAKSNGKKGTLTLKSGGAVTITPCDESQMAKVTAFGHTFEIQKNLVASIQRIDAKWQKMSPQYPIKTVGGYNCRTIANSSKLSYHAYGLAIDINEDANGVNTTGNMPAAFIQLWTDPAEGWGWGGNWKSYKDPMHFSKGANEQGDTKGE